MKILKSSSNSVQKSTGNKITTEIQIQFQNGLKNRAFYNKS